MNKLTTTFLSTSLIVASFVGISTNKENHFNTQPTKLTQSTNLVSHTTQPSITKVSKKKTTKPKSSTEAKPSMKKTKQKAKGSTKYRGIATKTTYVSTKQVAFNTLEGYKYIYLGQYKLTKKQVQKILTRMNNHPYMMGYALPQYKMNTGKNKKYVKSVTLQGVTGDTTYNKSKQQVVDTIINKAIKSKKFKKLSTKKKHEYIKKYVNKHIKLSYSANKKYKKNKTSKNIEEYWDNNDIYAVVTGKGTKTAKMRVYALMAKKAGLSASLKVKYNYKKVKFTTTLTKKVGKKTSKVKF